MLIATLLKHASATKEKLSTHAITALVKQKTKKKSLTVKSRPIWEPVQQEPARFLDDHGLD